MIRLGGDAREPGVDRWKRLEVVVAQMRDVGVGVERDVSDGVMTGGEVVVGGKMFLHHAERAMAFFHPVLEGVLLQVAAALDQREPEIGRADIGLETVLLEEHPLHRLGAVDAVLRRQRRAAGDVPEDGVRFGEIAARRDFEQRHLAVRILGQKFRRVALALEDVDLDQPVGHAQLRQGKASLVAVARTLHRIERKHRRFPKSRAGVSREYCAVTTSTRRCHGRKKSWLHEISAARSSAGPWRHCREATRESHWHGKIRSAAWTCSDVKISRLKVYPSSRAIDWARRRPARTRYPRSSAGPAKIEEPAGRCLATA